MDGRAEVCTVVVDEPLVRPELVLTIAPKVDVAVVVAVATAYTCVAVMDVNHLFHNLFYRDLYPRAHVSDPPPVLALNQGRRALAVQVIHHPLRPHFEGSNGLVFPRHLVRHRLDLRLARLDACNVGADLHHKF